MEAVMYGAIPARVQETLPALVRTLSSMTDPMSVEPVLSPLVEHGVLAHERTPVEFGRNAAFVSSDLYLAWQQQIRRLLPQYRSSADRHLLQLSKLLNDVPAAESSGLRWSIIAGWLLDIRMNAVLRGVRWQEREPDEFWVWIFERTDPSLTGFGVRTQLDAVTCTYFGEIWVAGVRKAPALPLNLRPEDIRAVWSLHVGDTPPAANLMRARYFGLVQRRGTDDLLAVPCFDFDELAPLLQVVDDAAREMIGRTLLTDGFAPVMPANVGDRRPIYMHAFARLFMQMGLQVLLQSEWLQRPRPCVTSAWGTWIAQGDSARQFFHPPYIRQDGPEVVA